MDAKKQDMTKSARVRRRNPYGMRGRGRQSLTLAACKSCFVTVVRQEYGQHPQKWQESTDFIDQENAGVVRNHPQHRGAKATHTEGKTEKESGNHTDTPGQQLLRVDQDSRKGGREDETNDNG